MAEALWPVALALLGALVGSFVATLVIRWPEERSVVRGRSSCDSCGVTLAPVDLIPLASAVMLRGRCRRCGAPIDPTHWRIEALCAVSAALAATALPGPGAIAGAVMAWLLIALAALDIAELWLPDLLTGSLAGAALIAGVTGVPPVLPDRLIGGATGFTSLWLIAVVYRRTRAREGVGGGDPKLFGAIGLWLGWRRLPAVLLIAASIGLGAVAVRRLGGRLVSGTDMLPLGAMLAMAAYPAWLFLIAFKG